MYGMKCGKRHRLASVMILLLVVSQSVAFEQEEKEPFVEESILWAGLDDPDAILLKEVEWAQKSMERYRRNVGAYPLRSDIQHDNIYSDEWVQESLKSLRAQEEAYVTRESRRKNRKDRFLRGSRDD